VCAERLSRCIPAFIGLVLLQEGEPCRSIYEAMYDACLHDEQTPHEHEVRVEALPYIADFRVGGQYVEIVGMAGFGRYRRKHAAKRRAYETDSVPVTWLYPVEVKALYADCGLPLRFRLTRRCDDCGEETHDLVKTVCRRCYMRRWHSAAATVRRCAQCGSEFRGHDPQRFCSHRCYSKSLELAWPDWEELDRRLAVKPIRQVAFDLGVQPSALYMRLRRRHGRR
jgi:hypothetical protein